MKRHFAIHRPAHRRGFVLVLTLAMILIAVMISARTANRSLTRTLQAIQAEADLQRRWGPLSLQQSLLARSTQVFHDAEVGQRTIPRPAWYDGRVELSGTTYRLRLADENAKVNLNHLRRTRPADEFRRLLTEVIPTSKLALALTNTSPDGDHPEMTSWESWGQVFPNSRPEQLIDRTASITCWGNGRLNLHRTSDKSIRLVLEPIIGMTDVDAILRQRREPTDDNHRTSGVPQSSLVPAIAAPFVTEESRCYSLWLISAESGEIEFHVREIWDRGSLVSSFRW